MGVMVEILTGALPRYEGAAGAGFPGAGAVVVFEGIVRPMEAGAPIGALEYTTYEPMAQNQLIKLGEEMVAKHGLVELRVWHSRGSVGVGECSFRLLVASAHRAEALLAMGEFIDTMKRDVPIWKRVPGA